MSEPIHFGPLFHPGHDGAEPSTKAQTGRGSEVVSADLIEDADANGAQDTAYTVSVGDSFTGWLRDGDTDWIALEVVEGRSYRVTLSSTGPSDPYLRLFDAEARYIGYDDDGGAGLNAEVNVTATYTGKLYLSAEEFNFRSGGYRLEVADGSPWVRFDNDQIARQLTHGFWGGNAQRFAASAGDTLTVSLQSLEPDGQRLARWALEAWTAVSGLRFQEVSSGAQIRFSDDAPGAFSTSSTSQDGIILTSWVNVSHQWLSTYGATIDSYAFQTYLHEIGHALGLGHAGNYNGGATYLVDGLYANDSWQSSVMSYFSQSENYNVAADFALVTTSMPTDILAIQALYGLSRTHNSGDTVYGFDSTLGGYVGALFGQWTGQEASNQSLFRGGPVALALHDTGGEDVLQLNGSVTAHRIDLTPESFSDLGGIKGNLSIARGTMIENATGGAGADSVQGNAAANRLDGWLGNDTILAGAGADTVIGGDGADFLRGDADNDLVIGSDGADTLAGDLGDDSLDGQDDDDELWGWLGLDSLNGGWGDDTLHGEQDSDTLDGWSGDDLLEGGPGWDSLIGGDGADQILGGSEDDTVRGGDGDDTVWGGDGADLILGEHQHDSLLGEGGHDILEGGRGRDTLDGGAGDDVVSGGEARDLLFGGAGNDILWGYLGADTLQAGPGDDLLLPEDGADLIIFADGDGADTLRGFDASDAQDQIDLRGVASITGLQDLRDTHAAQVGADVRILGAAGDSLLIEDVTLEALFGGDAFLF